MCGGGYTSELPGGRSGQLHRQVWGYKVWIVFDAECGLPVAIHVAPGNVSDYTCAVQVWRKAVQNLGLKRIQVLVMDRGFHSQGLWETLLRLSPKVTLVCRLKRGTKRLDRKAVQLKRQAQAVCAGYRCAAGTVRGGQVVWIHRPAYRTPLVLWTNNRQLSASQVYRWYRLRGRIERWIKDMKGEWSWGCFPGTKWGAVVGHIYLTVIAHLAQRAFQQAYSRKTHRWGVRRFRREVYEVVDPLPLETLVTQQVPLDRIRRNVRLLVQRLPGSSQPDTEEFSSIAATMTLEVPQAA